jgi:hypothetical protein
MHIKMLRDYDFKITPAHTAAYKKDVAYPSVPKSTAKKLIEDGAAIEVKASQPKE